MKALRWIAVLPAALVAVIASHFVLHFLLVVNLNNETIQTPVAPVERALIPFVAAGVFVAAGAFTAPAHRLLVGIALGLMVATLWALYLFGFFS